MIIEKKQFQIKLAVAIYKEKKLSYKNEMIVPTNYARRSEARAHIKKEIRDRLAHSSFFVSPRVDFDLVRYTMEATCNTYLRYRIIEQDTNNQNSPELVTSLGEQKNEGLTESSNMED